MSLSRRAVLSGGAGLIIAGAFDAATAQTSWPSKPITFIAPFPPGGTTDILARLIASKLSASLGQPVIVENKPGAGGNIGSDFVAKAAPDGYTILGGTISSHAVNYSLYTNLPYHPVNDFRAITMSGSNANILVVGAESPYKTLAELIAAAKANPGSINFASAGSGTSQHLSGELLKRLAGIDIVHVPYKGSAPAIQDVIGGHVPMMFDTSVVAAAHIRSGKVRALAVTSKKRVPAFADVPTVEEAGVPGYEIISWQGIFAPAKTPPEIIDRLYKEIATILKMPDVLERFASLGLEPSGITPEAFTAFQKAEIEKWAAVVKEAKLKVE